MHIYIIISMHICGVDRSAGTTTAKQVKACCQLVLVSRETEIRQPQIIRKSKQHILLGSNKLLVDRPCLSDCRLLQASQLQPHQTQLLLGSYTCHKFTQYFCNRKVQVK